MPPPALNFSTAHSVAFMPLMPGLAAIPVRGARMPILQGLAWAMAGANTDPEVAAAPVAAIDLSTVRRESFMDVSSVGCVCAVWGGVGGMIYHGHVSCHPRLSSRLSSRNSRQRNIRDPGATSRADLLWLLGPGSPRCALRPG